MKPDWWPKWYAETCANGHELAPGKVNLSWVGCDCPGATGGGHHLVSCRVNGCSAPSLAPPEHTGPIRDQR